MKKFLALLLSLLTAISCASCFGLGSGGSASGSGSHSASSSVGASGENDSSFGGYGQEDSSADAGIDKTETNKYLVKNNQTDYVIVIPQEPTATETYAANELKNLINTTAKCNITVEKDEGRSFDKNAKVLSVGKTVYQKGANLPASDYEGLNGGYLIKSVGDVYVLDADTKNGLVYAVNNFMKFYFGVEYLTWDYTYIPKGVENVFAYPADVKDVPSFMVRDFYSYPVWYKSQTEMSKLGMNTPSAKTSECFDDPFYYGYYYETTDSNGNVTKNSSPREGHTIESLLLVDAYKNGVIPHLYYRTSEGGAHPNLNYGYVGLHPDWYAYDPSYERANDNGYVQEEFCYSNGLTLDGKYDETDTDSFTSKIIEICKTVITEETSENATYFMLGHGDWAAQCECSKCKRMQNTFGSMFSGLYCVWANTVAEEIERWMTEEGIDRKVQFVIFAYDKSIKAPIKEVNGKWEPIHERVKLHDNIVIKMAYRNCCYHSLWDESCKHNETARQNFEQWSTLVNEFAIWDYSANFLDYLWYMPDYGTLKENYEYYQELNVKHLLTQGTPSEYNYYEYHLKAYVSLNLMWNVNQNVNELIEKFNRLYFGEKYAPYVNEYRSVFENHAAVLDAEREEGYHASTENSLDMKSAKNYSRAMLEGAIRPIDNAIAEVEKDDSLSLEEKEALILRLRSVKITPQYMMLKLNYIIDEEGLQKLATDFFESVDLLKLTYMKDGEIRDNMFDVMKESYGL